MVELGIRTFVDKCPCCSCDNWDNKSIKSTMCRDCYDECALSLCGNCNEYDVLGDVDYNMYEDCYMNEYYDSEYRHKSNSNYIYGDD